MHFLNAKPCPVKSRRASAHAHSADKSSARTRHTAQRYMEMAYAYCLIILAYDRCVFDILGGKERLKSRTSNLVAWAKAMSLVILIASAMLGPNFILIMKISVIISPTRQRQNQPRMQRRPPRHHRPPTQPVPSLNYSPFLRDFSIQEPSSLRFQPTFAGSSLGLAAPVKHVGFRLFKVAGSDSCHRPGSGFCYMEMTRHDLK